MMIIDKYDLVLQWCSSANSFLLCFIIIIFCHLSPHPSFFFLTQRKVMEANLRSTSWCCSSLILLRIWNVTYASLTLLQRAMHAAGCGSISVCTCCRQGGVCTTHCLKKFTTDSVSLCLIYLSWLLDFMLKGELPYSEKIFLFSVCVCGRIFFLTQITEIIIKHFCCHSVWKKGSWLMSVKCACFDQAIKKYVVLLKSRVQTSDICILENKGHIFLHWLQNIM